MGSFGKPNDSSDLENVHGGLSLKLSEVSRQTPVDFEGLRLVPQGILVIFCIHTAFQMTCFLGLWGHKIFPTETSQQRKINHFYLHFCDLSFYLF